MANYQAVRDYFPGMGQAVADRTVNRRIFTQGQKEAISSPLILNPKSKHYIKWKNAADLSRWPVVIDDTAPDQLYEPETRFEIWEEVAERVARGNSLLTPGVDPKYMDHSDYHQLMDKIKDGSILMSGRHLQHGDENQPTRPMEVFTNCSTAAASFLLFYLLLNGSGVGRSYDDDMMVVDWRLMPEIFVTIDRSHKDFQSDELAHVPTMRSVFARQKSSTGKVTVLSVEDSREGWAKAIEKIEIMAYEKRHNETLVIDFSMVRPKGEPIKGMQNRPASGPGPVIQAIENIAKLKYMKDCKPWLTTMMVDHYLADCVLVGGARRAARWAGKKWSDPDIIEYIKVKKNAGLWTANNSVTIDAEFRELSQTEGTHAHEVLGHMSHAAYHDGTGEPGIVNQDKLHENRKQMNIFTDGKYAESGRFKVEKTTIPMMQELASIVNKSVLVMIVNPCGEITILMLGGYCVIADVVPFHAKNDHEAEMAFRLATRALMRTNLMDCLYHKEVKRTNRIGVGITGLHEWIYNRFGFTWYDLIDEEKSMEMWLTLSRFKRAIVDEKESYARLLGVEVPHTDTTMKPAGTTSKLFGLTEGAHLPSMREFLRWVQFRSDDPLIKEYQAMGYPTRQLLSYEGTTIVGFPTRPAICDLDGGDWVVTAAEATPEEQYQFLRLLEKYWIVGVDKDGVTPLKDTGNQISYTLKYDPKKISFDRFYKTLVDGQFSIKCCSVMPQEDATAYEYQPEQPVSTEKFDMIVRGINTIEGTKEDIGLEHIDCSSGACPIDFKQ